jgi:uncharacterized protein (DUF2249 family)
MSTTTDPDARLDAREVEGEPFSDIVDALEDLAADETLLLLNSFDPEPLYDILDDRAFDHETECVDGEWRVYVTPR